MLRSHLSPGALRIQLLPHVPGAALGGLMAVWIAAGCPEDAAEEHDYDNGHDDEWGSDIHGGSIPHYQDYQRANRCLWLPRMWAAALLTHAGLS